MRFKGLFVLLLCITFFGFNRTIAQDCPKNIGFEDGTFSGWKFYTGTVVTSGSDYNFTEVPQPVFDRHTIIKNTSPQIRDVYGDFPINCPNGSGYSIRLGNPQAFDRESERITYTFTVPVGQENYSLIYYYAVVFQDPKHTIAEQPAFTANIYEESTNALAFCSSAQFSATSGLPGFYVSPNSTPNLPIYYKSWTPVTLNLKGYGGKTLRLEFTTSDCARPRGTHFGYAYIDVNENCRTPISGSTTCLGSNELTLTAPGGFEKYAWYTADLQTKLGDGSILKVSPPPPAGTRYALEVTPYFSQGCKDVLYVTTTNVNEPFYLNVSTDKPGCISEGVDITTPDVTAGSSSGLTFEYYLDPDGTVFLSDPKFITTSGTYYIRGTNQYGCTDIKPIKVNVYANPTLNITNPAPVCFPATVDITDAAITNGTDPNLSYKYYTNNAGTIELTNPKTISVSGTYYIKATNANNCFVIRPVNVTVGEIPKVITHNVTECPPISLTASSVTQGSTQGLTYTYWADANATIPLADPEAITVGGTYYIKGTSPYSCWSIAPVNVTINPLPQLTVKDPKAVVYPESVDISTTYLADPALTYSYWKDAAAVAEPLANYNSVSKTGTYYIKATNANKCYIIKPVHVSINEPPQADVQVANTFSPNGDGYNDLFKPVAVGMMRVNYLKVYTRWGQLVFETKNLNNYWDGTLNGKLEPAGAYYWVFSGVDTYRNKEVIKSGPVTIVR